MNIFIEGKFISSSDVENKGYKFIEVLLEGPNPKYPRIVKVRFGDDYKQFINKDGVAKFPLYLDCWDSRAKKFSPRGVNLNLSIAKKV